MSTSPAPEPRLGEAARSEDNLGKDSQRFFVDRYQLKKLMTHQKQVFQNNFFHAAFSF